MPLRRRSREDAERETTTWFALRLGETAFGAFDTVLDRRGRRTRLGGEVAAELMNRTDGPFETDPQTDGPFETDPQTDEVDVSAAKHPNGLSPIPCFRSRHAVRS